MQAYELYELWAPMEAVWSVWAKPVLFAEIKNWRMLAAAPAEGAAAVGKPDLEWVPPADGSTGVILDLAGVLTIRTGLALAARGYRPVPLYNTSSGGRAVLPVDDLKQSLAAGGESLAALRLPPTAPPVFLLDSRRRNGEYVTNPGMYDNRWVVFPQDFPSGAFLLSRGVRRIVVASAGDTPAEDLSHVLLRWQEAGVQILEVARGSGKAQVTLVRKPPRYRSLWYRALVLLGFRRNAAGAFGGVIPEPGSGAG